jgi:hypothetical protein
MPFLFQWFFQPTQGPGLLFSSLSFYTDGRTPWMSYQLVARPLPKHRTTQTKNKHIHIPNIHALSGIRTNDPRVENSSCSRQCGYCDRYEYPHYVTNCSRLTTWISGPCSEANVGNNVPVFYGTRSFVFEYSQ